jgi:hypothetical protein
VVIKRGIPWRNGVWRHRVIDGPVSNFDQAPWRMEGKCGDMAALTCLTPAKISKWMVGERGDSFVVSFQLQSLAQSHGEESTSDVIRRTGYCQLWSSLFKVRKTKSCQHHTVLGENVMLEPGWTTFSGFGFLGMIEFGKLNICLTAGSGTARWHALISIFENRTRETQSILLRGVDCCFSCAVRQASAEDGDWFLVL